MTRAEIEAAIDAIPGEGEWWCSAGRDEYLHLADELAPLIGYEAAIRILERAYTAAAGEFGN